MNSPVTKYLLMAPLSYILYIYYQDFQSRSIRQQLINERQTSDNLNHQYKRYKKCLNSMELGHIFKKSLKYIKINITYPSNRNTELVDCQIMDNDLEIRNWWNYPCNTKVIYRINQFNSQENRKEGIFKLLYWINLSFRQQLKLTKTDNEQIIVKEMLQNREKKCLEISQHNNPYSTEESQKCFIQCIRNSEGAARLLEKELSKIKLMKTYVELF